MQIDGHERKCPRGEQVDTSTEQSAGAGSGGRQVRKRKQWSVQEKGQIVRETLQSGSSAPIIARRHGVNANQIFTWRREYRLSARRRAVSLRAFLRLCCVDTCETVAVDVAHEVTGSRERGEPLVQGGVADATERAEFYERQPEASAGSWECRGLRIMKSRFIPKLNHEDPVVKLRVSHPRRQQGHAKPSAALVQLLLGPSLLQGADRLMLQRYG